jgi:LPXTG-motif cell wall-anchored protein
VDQTAVYRLVAWDVGPRELGFADAVALVDDVPQRVSLGDVRVFVRSVLPADSAQRIPKPPRGLIEPPAPWWWPWLPILIGLAIIGLLLWWYLRRRRRRKGAFEDVDPYELAEREFARVEALGLLEAGERGRFVALMVDVLRDYLARRLPGAAPSLTSTELLALIGEAQAAPVERLAPLLSEADLIKFARRPVSADRARELGRSARAIVRDVDQQAKRPVPAEAAA